MFSSGRQFRTFKVILTAAVFFLPSAGKLYAQELPAAIDPGRIPTKPKPELSKERQKSAESAVPNMQVPEGIENVHLHLSQIRLEGVTAYSANQLRPLFAEYLEKDITLAVIWTIAERITNQYRADGFFLSRAYVPAQEIEDGVVTIRVAEGYIKNVDFHDSVQENHLVKKLVQKLEEQKPLSHVALEQFMLDLEDLPGKQFRGIVEPLDNAPEGAVKLSVHTASEETRRQISFNNYGSRFLGPHQVSLALEGSILPLQRTSFAALTSLPTDELSYVSLQHEMPIDPDVSLEFSGSYVNASPGASLAPLDIDSKSAELGFGIHWQPIRRWQKNLDFWLEINGKNTRADILRGTPLTRDNIRVVRGKMNYDATDGLGRNIIQLTLSRGIDGLGSSDRGDANLSRTQARPDFTTAQLNYTREQRLTDNFSAIGKFSAQLASSPLFSAEEFGFGGTSFGRAFDPSEITGDQGAAASVELRYFGINPSWDGSLTPYTFYDIGKVWNRDTAGLDESASSTGFGVYFSREGYLSGNLGLSVPLLRRLENPLYGMGDNSRILLEVNSAF